MSRSRLLPIDQLRAFLDEKVDQFNRPSFIENDPISIPHRFTLRQDVEIAALFAATIAWGQRITIIRNCSRLMDWMDNAPYDFILHHQQRDLKRFATFVHRTFNATDLLYFIRFLRHHYQKSSSLESAFSGGSMEEMLGGFHEKFFALRSPSERTRKHVATPARNSACKRLNMFLRWMVRSDGRGVDFGLWKTIDASQLICPLDVHVQRVALELRLLKREQADWKAAVELTQFLRTLDPADPVKYDFALFGLGVEEGFSDE